MKNIQKKILSNLKSYVTINLKSFFSNFKTNYKSISMTLKVFNDPSYKMQRKESKTIHLSILKPPKLGHIVDNIRNKFNQIIDYHILFISFSEYLETISKSELYLYFYRDLTLYKHYFNSCEKEVKIQECLNIVKRYLGIDEEGNHIDHTDIKIIRDILVFHDGIDLIKKNLLSKKFTENFFKPLEAELDAQLVDKYNEFCSDMLQNADKYTKVLQYFDLNE